MCPLLILNRLPVCFSFLNKMMDTFIATPHTSGQSSKNPIIVDAYKSKDTSQNKSIDDALYNVHFFRINSFNFHIGDCLFDTIQVLLHCHYTSIEIGNGLVENFLDSFHHGSDVASTSFQHELHPTLLYDFHRVADQAIYL